MPKKYQKFILIIFLLCLIGAGIFCFLNIQKKESAQTKTTPNLKLLTSHSSPQTGENWVVSFETTGASDLTITPKDQDTIGDLDFVSLTCDSKEKTKDGSLQILNGDAVFYSGWECNGTGQLTHLVNIARKHTLKFQFGNKMAFAYNNPDSVTDSFTDESKIVATSSVVITGGQAKLATCGSNGTACSVAGECCSNYCVNSVCCNNICNGTPCYRCDSYSNAGAGTCGYVSTTVDPDSECTPVANASEGCRSDNCSGTAAACGVVSSGDGVCPVCGRCTDSDIECEYHPANTYDSTCSQCKGCSGSEIGSCSTNQTTSCGVGTYGCSSCGCNASCCPTYNKSYQKCSNGICTTSGCSCASCTATCGPCPD